MTDRARTWPMRRRRDRHARGVRGPLVPLWLPAGRVSRADRFDDLVAAAVDRLRRAWGPQLREVDVVVTDLPPATPPRDPAAEPIPLGRVDTLPRRPRLVVHRRPVERRAAAGPDRADLVADVVAELVADLLDLEPEQVDPGYPRLA